MWGRVIGLAVLLPAAGFWARGWLGPALKSRAVLYSGLVVAQGLLGWWMVRSGLQEKPAPTDIPRVSQYRLAAHLGMAVVLYSSMLYTALGLLTPPPTSTTVAVSKSLARLRHAAHGVTAVVFFTALSGSHNCVYYVLLTVAHYQEPLWLDWMLAWCTTPSRRWESTGYQRSGCNSHQKSRISLRIQPRYNLTTGYWQVHSNGS